MGKRTYKVIDIKKTLLSHFRDTLDNRYHGQASINTDEILMTE